MVRTEKSLSLNTSKKTYNQAKFYNFHVFNTPNWSLQSKPAIFLPFLILPYKIISRLFLTRMLSGFEILNNATLILQKWLVSRHFANIFHYLNFSEEYF